MTKFILRWANFRLKWFNYSLKLTNLIIKWANFRLKWANFRLKWDKLRLQTLKNLRFQKIHLGSRFFFLRFQLRFRVLNDKI